MLLLVQNSSKAEVPDVNLRNEICQQGENNFSAFMADRIL